MIICMSHGGVREPANGPITEGDDVNLARAVPEIDVIVGGHTHTFMRTPVIVNGTPIVQAGCYGQAVGRTGHPTGGTRQDGRLLRPAARRRHHPGRSLPHRCDEGVHGRDVAHSCSRREASGWTSRWR